MDGALQTIAHFINEYFGSILHLHGANDVIYAAIAIIIAICIVIYVTYYTVKKVIINLLLGYVVLYAIQYFLGITITPDYIMVALMILFGPIPVILAALWYYVM